MWKLKADDRLDRWKSFRQRLGELPLEQALVECQDFWQSAPFTPYYLDYHDLDKWPDPWQLVYENWYCDIAKALGIVYTLHLCRHGEQLKLAIHIYQDIETKGQYNLVWIDDGKYVLNFNPNEIVNRNIPNSLKPIIKLSSEDLKLSNY
jgi:hypothetical protein